MTPVKHKHTLPPRLPARLARQLAFVCEIDKVKSIFRHTLLMDGSRRENDAEHAWHLAMLVLLFADSVPGRKIDTLRVLKMVLIHDIVEIDAGDAFLYDTKVRAAHSKKEAAAARRIFGMLPADQKNEFIALWKEFEARRSPEAKFAAALDRFQPVLHNYVTAGRVWKRARVSPEQILSFNAHIREGSPELWECVEAMVEDGKRLGYFR